MTTTVKSDRIESPSSTSSQSVRRLGSVLAADGLTTWRVWAPLAKQVEVVFDKGTHTSVPMTRHGHGYFSTQLPHIGEGTRYGYRLDGRADVRPDPCSLWQPGGVNGSSAVFSPERFAWTDHDWKGISRASLAIYEMHIGTFTKQGTFEAAIERLEDLIDLGVTAIEIMPVAEFPGDRNWGYDGVLLFAAQSTYGGPLGLLRLVDAAHAKGLAVILDVVYNHFGPESNHIREFGPYFTERYKTPWGDAVNYDDRGSDGVREFVLENARMWLEDFHLDGLRLDAVHAIYDSGATHILREIADVARGVGERAGREIHVTAESDLNDPRTVSPPSAGGHGLDAQWSDDFHHTVHALLTGERRGYYVDFGEANDLAELLESPFLRPGQYFEHRGKRHGAPPFGLAGDRFVVCLQNHDQVGNRAVGDRLSSILQSDPHGAAKLRLAASLMLLSQYVPLLFMGEEYGEANPFPFFCSFESEELREAVRKGRCREFAYYVDEPGTIPDPTLRETFEAATLSWSWPDASPQAGLRLLYKYLLAARREWPALNASRSQASVIESGVICLTRGDNPERLVIVYNLNDVPIQMPTEVGHGVELFSAAAARFGGNRSATTAGGPLAAYECRVFAGSPSGIS